MVEGGRGGIGRHTRLRIWRRKLWGFKSLRPHQEVIFKVIFSMQIKRKVQQGLQYEFEVTVPHQIVEDKINSWLKDKAKTVKLAGFRPGKVPLNILQNRYGDQAFDSVRENFVQAGLHQIYKENNIKISGHPAYKLEPNDEDRGLIFSISFEALPTFQIKNFSDIFLDKLCVKVSEEEVQEALSKLVESHQKFNNSDKDHKVSLYDQVNLNIIGSLQNKKLKSYSGHSIKFIVGKAIKGFEFLNHALLNHMSGDKFSIDHTFPEDDTDKEVAGKKVGFEIEIVEVSVPVKTELNDEFAKEFGCDTLIDLREKVKKSLQDEYDHLSRLYHKRHLLDALAKDYDFDLPSNLVKNEFSSIWNRLQEEIKIAKDKGEFDTEDEAKSLKDYESEYQKIAERRVRLGLLVSEIAKINNIRVTPEMARDLIVKEAMRYPGQEKRVVDFYRSKPDLIERLTGPALEDMVIDFILLKVTSRETSISYDELQSKLKNILPHYEEAQEPSQKKSLDLKKHEATETENTKKKSKG